MKRAKLQQLHKRIEAIEATGLRKAMGSKNQDLDLKSLIHQLTIRSRSGPLQQFTPNKGQDLIIDTVAALRAAHRPTRLAILKHRQGGSSTVVSSIIFSLVVTTPLRSGQILAHRNDSAQKIFRITRRFWNHLPVSLKPAAQLIGKRTHKAFMEFSEPHASSISVHSANSPDIGRGETIDYAHWSEFAYWPNAQDRYDGLMQTIPPPSVTFDSCVIAESTANGPENMFADLYHGAERGESDWIALFLDWRKHDPACSLVMAKGEKIPHYPGLPEFSEKYGLTPNQQKWVRYILINQCRDSWSKFHQEYPVSDTLAFQFSGFPWISPQTIVDLRGSCTKPIMVAEPVMEYTLGNQPFFQADNGQLSIWEYPKQDHNYVVAVDTSEGIGADYAVIMIMDTTANSVVAVFCNNRTPPQHVGIYARNLASYYNDALLAIERNASGLAAIAASNDPDEYQNSYYEIRHKQNAAVTIRQGYSTTRKSKLRAMLSLQYALQTEELRIPNIVTVTQLSGIVWDPSSQNWQQTIRDLDTRLHHDDHMMALAIAVTTSKDLDRNRVLQTPETVSWL
jgi:hypothetical protein